MDGRTRVLADTSDTENPARQEILSLLVEDARAIGCLPALEKHERDIRYLLDERRSKYLDCAGFQDTDDALEIGCNLGQHTRVIAPQVRRLEAIEVVEMQARFARAWCDEEGLDNVTITSGAGSGRLPYDNARFHVVICNYVLEWCAGRSKTHPANFHRDFLAEMHRVLRPGGRLLLSTKNRFSLRYLTGAEDEHLGTRFGSALPRILSDRMRRAAKLGHTPGYLHSWDELDAILRDVGFSERIRLFSFPDHRYPDYVGPFEAFSPDWLSPQRRATLGGRNRLALLLPPALRAKTSNSIFFKAVK